MTEAPRVDAHHHVWDVAVQTVCAPEETPELLALAATERLTAGLDAAERADVFGGTAIRWYGLAP